MQAIILAAGMGKRLKEYTRNNTKCMVEVNGITIIERLLTQLDRLDLSQIIIVTGYEGNKLKDFINTLNIQTRIGYVDNPIFDRTNNIYSLSLAKDYLIKEDTLLFESDIVCEDSVINCLIDDPRDTLALVDKYEPWMDGTCIRIDEDDNIIDYISGRDFDFNNTTGCYKTVNIYKFSKNFSKSYYVPFLEAYLSALGKNEYYEQVLRVIALLDNAEIKAKKLENQKWYEIDDAQDLDIAEALFCNDDDEKVLRIEERYGGYWRFPNMLDFCYLVNPFYPPQKMKDEIKASFDKLICEYPSGMSVNSLLAAKNFGVRKENIVVGNGAAELIKSLLDNSEGMIGFIKPTFEEYPNRYRKEEVIVYYAQYPDYSYSVNDIISFFDNSKIRSLVMINPDNPSGNYIEKKDLMKLISWSDKKSIRLIIDESFADFADEEDNTLIDNEILLKYRNLIVIKSISKSYGVPGLRLGIMASGDEEAINKIKKDVSIWNINSFAEFYMQIAEKYKKDYLQGIESFKAERKRFFQRLNEIGSIRVIPSQANYFMIELLEGHKAHEVTRNLLVKYNILVKDLSTKLHGKEYIRIAIRNSMDNDRLAEIFKDI